MVFIRYFTHTGCQRLVFIAAGRRLQGEWKKLSVELWLERTSRPEQVDKHLYLYVTTNFVEWSYNFTINEINISIIFLFALFKKNSLRGSLRAKKKEVEYKSDPLFEANKHWKRAWILEETARELASFRRHNEGSYGSESIVEE